MKKYLLDKSGEVTVFLTLLFLLIIGFSFCILEGMHDYSEAALAEDAVIGAGEYVTSNYDRELFRRYHIFFLDPREKDHIEEDGKAFVEDYFDDNRMYSARCESISVSNIQTATDKNGKYLRHQIREFMKYQSVKDIGSGLFALIQKVDKENADSSSVGSQMAKTPNEEPKKETDAESDTKEEEGKEEEEDEAVKAEREKRTVQWKTLKDNLVSIAQSGILGFAVGKGVSKKSIETAGLPSKMKGISGEGEGKGLSLSFSNVHEIKNLLKGNNDMGGVTKQISDNLFVLQYIFDCFTFYGSDDSAEGSEDSVQNPDREEAVHNPEEDTHALKYEIEYLVAGNNTDKKNLSYVVNRLLFIRFATNFLHACTSAKLLPVVEGVSDILGGLLGFPAAAVAVKFIILASLSIGETYIDMRTVMHGERVPVVKNDANWNLFLENITSCFKKGYVAKQGSVNVSYNDFLLLLLLKNWKGTRIYYRMMDIMQVNVALEESGFEMKDCIFSYQWDWKLSCPTWFRVIPAFGIRTSPSFTRNISKICTY